jgi:hypothetical protein
MYEYNGLGVEMNVRQRIRVVSLSKASRENETTERAKKC